MKKTANPKVTGKYFKGKCSVTKEFIISGMAIFTVGSSHQTYTYKITKHQSGYFTVFALLHPENKEDYTYIGILNLKPTITGYVKVGMATGFANNHSAVVMFDWALDIIMKDRCTPTGYKIAPARKGKSR